MNGLDVVPAGNAGADESWLFGVKEPCWREFLTNSAVICAAHVSFLGCSIIRLEKIRNGLGHWLTFVTEPTVDSTNNRAERALREQVMLRKMFRSLRAAEGVWIHETITTMLATWERRGLDPPEQLQAVLGGRELNPP